MAELAPLDRESVIEEARRLLPEPVRDESQLDGTYVLVGGDPGEVVVSFKGSTVSVAIFSVRWEGPHTPVVCPQKIASLNWKRIPATRTMMSLHALIEAACEIRRSKYRKCKYCEQTNPPEWMHSDDVCQSCAERHLGVVH